jgi:hypothetical protein
VAFGMLPSSQGAAAGQGDRAAALATAHIRHWGGRLMGRQGD